MRHLAALRSGRLITLVLLIVAGAVTISSGLLVGRPTPGARSTSSLNRIGADPSLGRSPSPFPSATSSPTPTSAAQLAAQSATGQASPTARQTSTPSPATRSGPKPRAAPSPSLTGCSSSSFVTRSGTVLCLSGHPWTFTGVNAYEAATDWGTNYGCGVMPGWNGGASLDTLFSSLRPNDVVRFWAFQALATNYTTKQLDWGPIDNVINTAAKYGIKVIPSLTDQSGICDDNYWHDAAWYDGGFRNVYDLSETPNSTPLSYWDYVQAFAEHYKDNATIAMIELVSEPSPTEYEYQCVNESVAAHALRYFFDTIGAEIRSIDPNHLIETGMQGEGQCGAEGSDYGYVNASPYIDVASVHDYTTDALPTVPGTELVGSLAQANADGKPLIVGEVGEQAQNNLAGCATLPSRVNLMEEKMIAQFRAGIKGFLAWDWEPSAPSSSSCEFDFGPKDPLIAALDNF
jgi:mannan endo-1,4-beta-mannosidase